jgi:hypothetical protein
MSNGAGGLGHKRDPESEFYGCLWVLLIWFFIIPFGVYGLYRLVEWLRN